MDILDADENPLYSTRYKKYMDADIVQFVPFRDFRNNPIQLAKETLEEVPGQMLNFFRKNQIVPLPALEAQKREIQKKLSMQKSLNSNNNGPPEFFVERQERFMQKMAEMGMDIMDVKDFIEDKGLVEENPEILLDYLNDPRYVNVLRP